MTSALARRLRYFATMPIGKKKILIVEDNEDLRELVTLILASAGYQVFEAGDGLEALKRVSDVQPDLILMDLSLPKMSGSEVIRRLKENPSTRDIPVVVQTAHSVGEQTQYALQAGATEVLLKPVPLTFLRDVIRKYASVEDGKRKLVARA
jgi:CheY-like chemotaxis protein